MGSHHFASTLNLVDDPKNNAATSTWSTELVNSVVFFRTLLVGDPALADDPPGAWALSSVEVRRLQVKETLHLHNRPPPTALS